MQVKNALLFLMIFLSFFVFQRPLYAPKGQKRSDEQMICGFVSKYICCFKKNHKLYQDDQDFFLEEFDSSSFQPSITKHEIKSRIERLPLEIFYKICYELPPPCIVSLSLASKDINMIINNNFWEDYIRFYKLKKWEYSTPAIKVAFAYSFFEKKNLEKAALLGFPQAIKSLRDLQEKRRQMNKKRVLPLAANPISYPSIYGDILPFWMELGDFY